MPLSNLNSAQYEAVSYLDGPCLVIAGAGSGKTRVITQKIAHLIKSGAYLAKNIAALTFTNKAAKEMKERIGSLLKDPSLASDITISTFHSLGVQILREECAHLGLKPRFSIMDASDALALIQDLAVTTDKGLLRRIQTQISLWKNASVSPEDALRLAESEGQGQFAKIYASYNATLAAYQSVDFDDLIRLPVELFKKHPDIRDKWQRRLRYLLIDEYQDTNLCQYELILLLVTGPNKKPMFTAVGDDDQAIYAWRGATTDNLVTLNKDFPSLKLIRLEQNYRSCNAILNAANAVISHNPKMFDKKLWSSLGPGDPIKTISHEDDEAEAEKIAILLSAHKFERRAKFSDYAILYRGNHQSRALETALRRENIPYTVSGGQSFFARSEIKDIVSYLRLIANNDDDPAFIRAATTPKRGIGKATLEKLSQMAAKWKCSLFEAVFKGSIDSELTPRQIAPLRAFCDFINDIEVRASRVGMVGDKASELLDEMVKGIEYERFLYESNDDKTALSKWTHVNEFTSWLKDKSKGDREAGVTEKSLLELTQMVALMTMLEGKEEEVDAVRLSTLHAAKGLEFSHVFLVGVEEGLLPHLGNDDIEEEAGKIEEERRLMYVGITRAKKSLHVSWCKKRKKGRDRVSREASRFIAEMGIEKNKEVGEKISPQERLAQLKALLQTPKD